MMIQSVQEKGQNLEAAKLFESFAEEHKNTEEAIQALWKALSLSFSNGRPYEGAELAQKFSQTSTDTKQIEKALEQAATSYVEVGEIVKAAQVFEKLGKHAMALELYELTTNKEDIERLRTKIKEQKLEPYYSEFLLTSLNEKINQKKYSLAFEFAKQIINGTGTPAQRAKAKLVQAKILEIELVSQSVKAKMDRIATVLALKTEKLEKATSSYTSALKLSDQSELKIEALNGLKRCYDNYVQSISNFSVSDDVSTEDFNTLKSELAKLTAPINEKSQDIEKNIKDLTPSLSFPTFSEFSIFSIYIPAWPNQNIWKNPKDLSSTTCNSSTMDSKLSFETLSENINKCVHAGNVKLIESGARILSIKDPKSPWGSFYHAMTAELNKNYHLALWYLELSLKKKSDDPLLLYNKSRILFALGQTQEGIESMKKLSESFTNSAQINEAVFLINKSLKHDKQSML
jgi:hypothetical protein